MADKAKLTMAVLVLLAGIVGFYMFEAYALWMRVVGMLAFAGISLAIAAQAEPGRAALGFVREARTEVRKVVWPTRKETIQTTLTVMVMVVVVAIMLWLLDMFLLWAVQLLTGQGG
jgi:preprotein translocase subunit SecE